ncbi:MAG: hypothetical protein HY550_00990 [Elusimicrobia bacterium]|nr:hypothetical protein [Elusimicrobiota bacterium]
MASDRWGTGLYVADSLNFRVQKFDYDGKFLFEFGRAGSGPGEFGGPVQATEGPGGDAAGGRNQLFVADPGNYRIQIFTNAGEYQDSFGSRGGGPGQFESLYWVAATDPGNFVFTSDEALNRVQQFTIGGGYMGEIGAGLLSAPRGLALDVSGLYVVDSGNRRVAVFNTNTRELTASWPLPSAEGAGIHVSAYNRAYVSDLAGRIHIYEKTGKYLGSIGGQGNDPLEFSRPLGLATDRAGLLYVADSLNDRVQKLKVHTEDVEIPSTPGNLVSKYTSPYYADLEFTASGDDGGTGQAAWYEVKISPTGPVDTEEAFAAARLAKAPHLPAAGGSTQSLTAVGLAGGGRWHIGVRAWDESGNRSGITAIALDTSENVREGDLIRYAGLPVVPGFGGRNENWPATLSQISVAKAVGVGKAGALYIAQGGGGTGVVKVVAYADNNITREAGLRGGGGYNGDGIPAPTALLNDPTGVTADGGGNIYLSDTLNNRIRKVDAASGLINTVAGNGTAGYSGDGGPAAAAALNKPRRLSFDRLGNIYFADTGNNRVRRVEAATGIITTIAGNGTAGYAGDGGSAAQSALNTPSDAEADSRGNVYIADTGNNRVRRIDAAGNIATVAGGGTGGDGGQAAEAALSEPADVSVDPLGNIYIAERSASKVRRIGVDGVITTVAGTGVKGTLGVNGPVNTAQLSWPGGVAGDWERGRLYISEDARVTALGMAPFLTALSTATPGGASEVTIISTAAYNMVPVAQLDISTLIAVAAASEEVPVSAFYEINTVVKAAEAAVAVRVLKAGVNDASALALYRFNGVDWDSSTVVGQYMADMAGYYEAGGTTKLAGLFGVFETRRDYVAPVTGFTIEGAAYLKEDGALYLGAGAAIKLTASDEGTGVLSTEYRLEVATAGSFALISSGTYGAPLSPGVDGEYLISWHSADHVGNVELEQSTRVYVDGTAPTTVFEVAGSTLVVTGGFYILDGSSLTLSKAGAEISLGAVDDPVNGIASGVALTTYTFAKLISSDWVTLATGTGSGPFMMSEEGSYRIDYQSIDNVGNIETPKSLFPTVDGTAPATYVEIKGVRPAGNATVYMTGADTVAFIAADSVSGAASTYYTIDLEFSTTTAAVYTGPFTLAMGTHTLYYMSVDKVGNSETVRVLTVAVDTLAPFTSVYVNETLTSSAAGTGYMRPGSSVTLIASETLENGFASGVAYTLYALSKSVSGAWVELASGTYSAPFMFNDTGSYRLSYRSGDRAGNEEPEKEIYLEALPPLTVEHLLDIGGYGTGAGKLNVPYGVASDRWGTGLYVADSLNFRVQKFDYDGKFLFEFGRAGSGPGEFGGPVQAVEGPGGDATGIRNQLYVADPGNYRVQIFSSDGGYLNSFGSRGSGPGQFEALYWVASEESSSFIFAGDESLNRVQQFNVGGAYMGEIGAGILSAPRGIAFDASGLYVVDSGNRRVAVFNTNTRELTASWPLPSAEGAGIHVSVYNRVYVSDLAGRIHVYEKTGKYLGFVGGPGSDPLEFNRPLGLATDRAGLLYVADSLNDRVQKIKVHTEDIEVPSTPGSLVSKYTAPYYADLGFTASGDDGGTGQAAWYEVKISSLGPVDTEEAFAAAELSKAPHLTAVGGSAQNLTATGLGGGLRWHVGVRAWDESGNRSGITAITLDTSESVREGDLIYYAGLPAVPGFGGRKDNWPATLSQIGTAKAVGVGKAGTLLIAQGALGLQGGTGMIRAVAYADNNITRAAGRLSGGGYSPDGIPAVGMLLNSPAGVAADNGGNIYLSDTLNNRIRKVDAASGLINTVAGNGTAGYAGDGGPAAAAALNKPRGLSLDRSGNIYFADTGNNRVRRVDAATGMITTIAGNGTAGYSGDGGPAATALLNAPGDAEADGRGNVYIADTGNNRVRLIDAAGNITTIAGGGTAGDGAPAAEAALSEPTDVSVDPLGNVYVAERSANKVRRISVDGIINTAAGTGVKGTLGMNGPVDAAQLSWPGGVAGDWERGRLYISEDARVTALGMAPFFTSRSTATAQGESEVTVISTAAYNILPVAELDISTLIAVAAASEEVLVGAVHEISSVEKGAEAAIALRVLKTGVNDASALALYRFNGVDWDSSTIAGQYVADRGEYYEAGGTTKFAALFGVFETRPDHVPPVTGFNIEGVSYLKEDGAHYLSPSAAVKLTASDAGTGVSSTEYRLDVSSAGSFALVSSGTYGAPLGPGIDGEYLVSWHSADHVGNVELEQSTRVYVDGTAPVTAFEVAGSSLVIDGRLYILDGSSLTLSASDAFSGVKETYYALDGSTAAAVSPPVLPVSAGEHTLIFHTVDNLGNMESEKSLIFFVDAEAPVTTAAVAGLMGGNGWHVSPVSLTLVSTDAMSGVETVFYSLEKVISDSGRLLVSSGAYPGPLLAGSEGIYAYSYYSADRAGNPETQKTGSFKIDISSPSLIAFSTPAANTNGWNNTAVTAIFSGTDSASGIAFCTPDTQLSLEGSSIAVNGYCSDYAGLASAASLTVNIDTTAPAIGISSPAAGRIFVATRGGIYLGFGINDNLDPAPAFEAFLVQTDDKGSPLGDRPAVIAVADGQSIEPLDIDDGIWRLTVSATDFADNTNTLSGGAFEVVHDVLAPRTAQTITGGASLADGATTYITSATELKLASADDLVEPGDAAGLGVKNQAIQLKAAGLTVKELAFENPEPKQGTVFVSTFTAAALGLPDGIYSFGYRAGDILENREAEKTFTLGLDNTAPETTAGLTGTAGENGWHISSVAVKLAAADALSGVEGIYYQLELNGQKSETRNYTEPFTAGVDGAYSVYFYAKDKLGNTETEKVIAFKIDLAAPVSAHGTSGIIYSSGTGKTYLNPASGIFLNAADPVSGGTASGIDTVEYYVDSEPFIVYTASFSLTEGIRTVNYRSRDKAGNTEAVSSAAFLVDGTAPATTFNISGPLYIKDGVRYITPESGLIFTAADPLSSEVAAGVEYVETEIDSGQWLKYTQALKFAEGRHIIKYRAIDNVGNVEAERSLEVQCDNTAPVSKWSVSSGERIELGNKFYLNVLGRIALESADPPVYNVASGLENIYYGIDAAPATKYTSVLGLVEGARILNYKAKDNVGNTEVVKSTVIYVDGTKPVTELTVSGDQYQSDRQYISQRTDIVIAAVDPVVNEVSVGVKETKYAVDGGGFGDYSQFKLSTEGKRVVSFYSADHVNNVEATKTTELWVDATTPLTTINIIGGRQYAGTEPGSFYASLATEYAFTAVDPVSAGGAAGVKNIEFTDNGGALKVHSQPIALGEGKHTITYRATDRVENIEVFRSTQVYVDNTAPVTVFNISEPLYIKDGVRYITPASGLTFTAADPLANAVAAGVERIETAIDGGQWLKYTQALKFAEGRHTIKYRTIDNVGNMEAERVLEVQSDATAPESRWLAPSGDRIEKGGKFHLNALGSIALESSDPVVGAVASGVEGIYYGIDAAAANKYAAPFGLTEGIRTINFSAKDNVDNTEVAKSTAIYVDGTKPLTALSLSGDQSHSDKQYISQRTDIIITALDPVVSEVAVGVKTTGYRVEGIGYSNEESAYTSPFKLNSEGKHIISFYSTDYVNNAESVKTAELWADNTAPATALTISGVRYSAPGEEKIHLTKDSAIVLTPADPLSNDTASGVMLTKYRIDGGNWQVYLGSFTIAVEGLHTLEYYSLDRVQNAEALKSVIIAVDNTPPATGINLGEPRSEVIGLPVLMPNTPITLTAADPVMNGVAAGLNSIFYEIENVQTGARAPVEAYTSPFTIPEQGTFIVRYWSKDNVNNTEAAKVKMAAVSTWRADGLIAASGLDMSGTADIAGAVKSNVVVSLGGNARILGDVTASTITLSGKAEITGMKVSGATPVNPAPLYLAGLTQSAAAINNNALAAAYLVDGKLVLGSQAGITLTTGTYYFKGLELGGGSSITIAGKVDILVEGGVTINGGSSLNASGPASGLSIIVSTSSELKFNGGAALAACLYAPYSDMKLTGNALLGGHYFVKTAAVSGTGNLLQSGEALPAAAVPAGGGPKTKASAMPTGSAGVLAGPDPAFRLGEVYVFPNPAKGNEAPVFHIETGIADSVKITIYTISGRAAHEQTLTGLPVELDDGNGLSYAYEYVWRGHIPTGVYLYSIEAQKAGQKLKKTGKFGVVR